MTARRRSALIWPVLGIVVVIVIVIGALVSGSGSGSSNPSPAFTPSLDPGTSLRGQAHDFTLTDQFGTARSLHSFRGHVVLVAFTDSECTTVCPLTTTSMLQAQRMLGAAGRQVTLLGIDANPAATSVADVRAYSQSHDMMRSWYFLTGSPTRLRQVWHAYNIAAAIEHGQVDHTPALFLIGPTGTLAKVYITQLSYTSIDQQAQILAQDMSALLPGHPAVHSHLSYAQAPTTSPTRSVTVPVADGGVTTLGPGAPRLLLFFATWDAQVMRLGSALRDLSAYQAQTATAKLPALTAVDEGSVESSASALTQFLHGLGGRLAYPVAIDRTGALADGYGVQDQPWFVLVSGSGHVLWYYDVSTSGWLGPRALVHEVRAALSNPKAPSAAQSQAALAGAPAALGALHAQASQLLGDESALMGRLRQLRGYPVVVNAWASWCSPCRQEFGLFAAASARYGAQVGFLGADTSDSAGDARTFLGQHHVGYPSYQARSVSSLNRLAVVTDLPTTIFINRAGKVASVHIGEYENLGSLEADVRSYALGG